MIASAGLIARLASCWSIQPVFNPPQKTVLGILEYLQRGFVGENLPDCPPIHHFSWRCLVLKLFWGQLGFCCPQFIQTIILSRTFLLFVLFVLKLSGKPWLGRHFFFAIRVYTAQLYLFGGYQRLANIDG